MLHVYRAPETMHSPSSKTFFEDYSSAVYFTSLAIVEVEVPLFRTLSISSSAHLHPGHPGYAAVEIHLGSQILLQDCREKDRGMTGTSHAALL